MHSPKCKIALTMLFALAAVSPATAADVTVTNAWFRALPGGLPAGGYFSMHNGGSAPLDLVSAESAACGMLMLHESNQSGGVSHMDDVKSVTVPSGGSITFAPGGYHLMCMNPTAAMAPGKTVTVKLGFANGAHVDKPFAVKNAGGK